MNPALPSSDPALTGKTVPGAVYRVRYPFVRCEVDVQDDDPEGLGYATIQSWRPGVEHEAYGDDTETFADGEGFMVLTVIDVHKPGKFPARVFFTRSWVSPDGKAFGKGALRITTSSAFKRRVAGYMHEYQLREWNGQLATTSPNEKAASAVQTVQGVE